MPEPKAQLLEFRDVIAEVDEATYDKLERMARKRRLATEELATEILRHAMLKARIEDLEI